MATFGILLTVEALTPGRLSGSPSIDLAIAGILVALVVGAPAVLVLWMLHRSGRRLARAAGYWSALPYRTGARRPMVSDYFTARWVGYSPDLLPRIITVASAFLASAFSVSMIYYFVAVSPDPAFVVAACLWSVLFLAVTAGQFGGVQRIQNGYGHRDPLGHDRRMRRSRA
ncbi:hypothetical protein [Microbacterium lushaniae]|uniref:Uncharacterized protein n=1 Tax=Microbacterium lushaniae TaxID=2614639 RepID=A0A5J6L6F1_9MICO|nr:hypothetical protein [Microbacterium lushaniae]QEW03996.1 hypothetical protein F6J85_13460 [Microbacterium lushaniae]